MEYKTIITLNRKGKEIVLFLRDGFNEPWWDNIVDAYVNEFDEEEESIPLNQFLSRDDLNVT